MQENMEEYFEFATPETINQQPNVQKIDFTKMVSTYKTPNLRESES